MNILAKIKELVINTPNDQTLGVEIRKLYNNMDNDKSKFIICIKCGVWQSIFNQHCKYCGYEIQSKG